MIILGVDTSGADCGAVLYDSAAKRVLAERQETIGKGHAERLMDMIDAVLSEAELPMDAIGKIGVSIGPGSFTGIRVGVAAARGLALALNVPVVGVTSFKALASACMHTIDEEPLIVALDAKRGDVFLQHFDSTLETPKPAHVMPLEDAKAYCKQNPCTVIGSAAKLIDNASLGGAIENYAIRVIAELAASMDNKEKPKPLYLRGPDAKPQAGFAVARQ